MDGGSRPRLLAVPPNLVCIAADARSTDALFAEDAARNAEFHAYLGQGYRGMYLHEAGCWVAHGWVSPAGTRGPPHLAIRVSDPAADWLFAFHTREPYRRQGLYKALLGRLASNAVKDRPEGRVFVDTGPRNLPSRRAIAAVGFEPAGVVTTFILGVPKLRWWRWGRWDPARPHPALARHHGRP